MGSYAWPGTASYRTPSPLGLQVDPAVIQALGGRPPVDALDFYLFSTFRFKAATAAPTGVLKFFSYGLGQQIGVANAATEQYTAGDMDTNLERAFNLPAFTCMV